MFNPDTTPDGYVGDTTQIPTLFFIILVLIIGALAISYIVIKYYEPKKKKEQIEKDNQENKQD